MGSGKRLCAFAVLVQIGVLLLSLGGFEISTAAGADETAPATLASKETVEGAANAKRWSAFVTLSGNADLQEVGQSAGWGLDTGATWKWNEIHSTTLNLTASNTVIPENEFEFGDLALIHSAKLNRVGLSVQALLPTSQVSQDATLITSIKTTANYAFQPWKVLMVRPELALTGNIHTDQFAVGKFAGQKQNVRFVVAPGILLGLTLGNFSATTKWAYLYQRTHAGSNRHQYSNMIELGYAFNSTISLAVGLSNKGQTTRNGGRTNNITVFNQDLTEVYGATTVSF